MNRITAQTALLFITLAVVLLPSIAAAYSAPNLWGNPPGFWGPLVSCTGNYTGGNTAGLPPCRSLCDLIGTIINIIYFGITICIFILAPFFFAVGGIMIMASGANPEMLSQGKRVITGAAIGVAIVLSAYLIVATFIGFIGATGVGGFSSSGSWTFSCNA